MSGHDAWLISRHPELRGRRLGAGPLDQAPERRLAEAVAHRRAERRRARDRRQAARLRRRAAILLRHAVAIDGPGRS